VGKAVAFALVLSLLANGAPAQNQASLQGFGLEDGTPVKLRLARNVSSADAQVGETLDFEVLDEIRVGNTVVVPVGSTAWATVTEAQPKRRMGRAGKLSVNIDAVRLANGQKAALRAVQGGSGGSHAGAVTGAVVATSLIVWPAAPLFLLMKGKDITIPKGTVITAYINGNIPLDRNLFESRAADGTTTPAGGSAGPAPAQAVITILSTPDGAELEVDGSFVGNTPTSIPLLPGDHEIVLTKKGYKQWSRRLRVTGAPVTVSAEMDKR
jgi:hypothetical protein